jgi:hypothetical protein
MWAIPCLSQKTIQDKRDSLAMIDAYADRPQAEFSIINNVVISKARLNSLRLTGREIKSRKILLPYERIDLYRTLGEKTLETVTTRKLIIVNQKERKESEGLLILTDEGKIKSIKSIDADKLLLLFKLRHKYGAIVVETNNL